MSERSEEEWQAMAQQALEAEAQLGLPDAGWFEVLPDPHNLDLAKIPAWQRRSYLDKDGNVFAPAAVAGNEQTIFLCAGYDGTPCLMYDGHPFFSTDWMAREFPKSRECCEKIKRKTLAVARMES